MDKQIPTPVLYLIGVVLLALVVLGAIKAMEPHERVVNDPNEAQEFHAAMQKSAGQAQHQTWTNAASSPGVAPYNPSAGH